MQLKTGLFRLTFKGLMSAKNSSKMSTAIYTVTQADLVHRMLSINYKDQSDQYELQVIHFITLLIVILYMGFPMCGKHVVVLHTI